jgi:hypothetical protein
MSEVWVVIEGGYEPSVHSIYATEPQANRAVKTLEKSAQYDSPYTYKMPVLGRCDLQIVHYVIDDGDGDPMCISKAEVFEGEGVVTERDGEVETRSLSKVRALKIAQEALSAQSKKES